MVTKIEAWRSADGETFNSRVEAETHQARRTVSQILDKAGVGKGGNYSNEMIAECLIENATELQRALSYFVKTEPES